MERGAYPSRLKQLDRDESYALLDGYLELGDLFEFPPRGGPL
jgi:hypothetical protein